MSHSGWSTSNYISAVAGTLPTAAPLTIHCRYNPSSRTAIANGVDLYEDAGSRFQLRFNQTTAAIVATAEEAGTANAVGATALSVGTWYSCVALFVSATDRQVYRDGVQDGTNATSKTPSITTPLLRVGLNSNASPGNPALGSLAEIAVWSVALTVDEIAALVHVSPLVIRPQSLVSYIPLLESGTIDLVAPAATVTGTLTKDNDHPRVIYHRRRGILVPFAAGGGSASGVGSSAGTATAAATGQSTARASSTVAGTGTVAATGRSTAAAVGNAAGTSTAAATGTFTGEVQAVGTAAGTSTASAVGFSLGGIQVGSIPDGRGLRRKTLPYGWWAEVEKPAQEIAQAEAAIAEARAEVKAGGEVQPGTLKQLDTALWFADVETKLSALEAAETKRKAQAELNAIAAELAQAKAEYERMLDEQDEEEAISLLLSGSI
jgi:hypothetical protein